MIVPVHILKRHNIMISNIENIWNTVFKTSREFPLVYIFKYNISFEKDIELYYINIILIYNIV